MMMTTKKSMDQLVEEVLESVFVMTMEKSTDQLVEEAMETYRQLGFKEETLRNGKTVLFRGPRRKYRYPVNQVTQLRPMDYFLNDSSAPFTGLEDWIDFEGLNEILASVDPLLFLTVNQIIVLKTEEEISAYEAFIGRRLNRRHLGSTTYDTNHAMINWHRIMSEAYPLCGSSFDFFQTVVYQFYITLFHELGHQACRLNYLSEDCSALEPSEEDEESFVETFAHNLVELLETEWNVFAPFSYEKVSAVYESFLTLD